MIAAILGFMAALDRCLSISKKSRKTAKVVPKPATKPKISERWKLGSRRLYVS